MARLRTGKPSLAVWPLERAAEDPTLATPAGLLLAETALALKGYVEALRHLDRILVAEPGNADALRLRANVQLAAGRREAALVDAERLVGLIPGDYDAQLLRATLLAELGRLDEAEVAHRALSEAASGQGATTEAKACLALATFYSDTKRDAVQAERHFEACLDAHPTDALVLRLATRYLDASGRGDAASERWRRALDAAPDEFSLQLGYAERLASRGDRDTAERVLEAAAERSAMPAAWLALAQLRRQSGRTQAALEATLAAQRAAEARGDPVDDELWLLEADLRVDAGDHAGARSVAARFELAVYRQLIEGRILLAEGRAEEAQASFQAGILAWPNNAGARYGSGLAARALGRFDEALEQLREAERADSRATDAGLLMAEILLARGEPAEAHAFALRHLQSRDPRSAAAHRTLVASSLALGATERARREVEVFCARGEPALHCALQRAAVARASGGAAAQAASLVASGLDLGAPAHEEALRVAVQASLEAGRTVEARTRVDAALAAHPEHAPFHALRGALRLGQGDEDGARSDFETALARDASCADAHAGLGLLARAAGRLEEAFTRFDAAARAAPSRSDLAYRAAQLELALGRRDAAEQRLRALVRRDPGQAEARNDLAWLLAERRFELDFALALASQAAKQAPGPTTLDTLGFVHLQRGEPEAALEAFEEAIALRPDAPGTLYRAALAHKQAGDPERAIALLEEALAVASFPQADAARRELETLREARRPAT